MKHKTIQLSLLFLSISLTATGQQAIISSGGDSFSSSGSLSYSIGQVVYTTNSNNEGTVSKGVQQTFEIFTLSFEDNRLDVSLSVYPNPTTSHINLRIDNQPSEDLSFKVYDLQGKLLSQGDIKDKITQIDMKKLQSATYLVNIIKDHKPVKHFKVIKAE